MMSERYYIGLDGGGTTTAAVVLNESGQVLFRTNGETINFHSVGFEKARANLHQVFQQIDRIMDHHPIRCVYIGCSALDGDADDRTMKCLVGDYYNENTRIYMSSDAHVALVSAHLNKAGIIIISGTGSMGLGRKEDGEVFIVGGWGYGIGDEGSAYFIANQGIRAAIRGFEGMDKKTKLLEAMMEFYQVKHPREMINKIYQPTLSRNKISDFAPAVYECALNNDEVSNRILVQTTQHLTDMTHVLIGKIGREVGVGVYGSVFKKNKIVYNLFRENIKNRYSNVNVFVPTVPPEIGAALEAMRMDNINIDHAILNNMKKG